MKLPSPVRRALVTSGVIASLAAGVVTVQAAAEWTARSAPLAVAPESVDSLEARLAAEESRSAALQAQLDELRGHATDLASALDAATARIATDAETAKQLQHRLAAAKKRLAALDRLIARARTTSPTTASRPAATQPPVVETEHEEEEHDG